MTTEINDNRDQGATCPWAQITKPPDETVNFAAIIKNQQKEKITKEAIAKEKLKEQEERELEEALAKSLEQTTLQAFSDDDIDDDEWDLLKDTEDEFNFSLPPEVLAFLKTEEEELAAAEAAALAGCESDAVIAQMLQSQFDREYNEDVKRLERAQNKQSKVTVCLDKYLKPYLRDAGEEYDDDAEYEEDEAKREKRDWDRFETNERILEAIPKCGYGVDKDGGMITKHDADLCGVRNACRMMSFPVEFATGDGAGFDIKLSNRVNIGA